MTLAEIQTADAIGDAAGLLDSTAPGTRRQANMTIGTMASGQQILSPFLIARGAETGPVLWLNGAVHGDEINGILAISDFMSSLDLASFSGTVIATPVSNPTGLDARRKRVPQDEQDLDQSFPGQNSGMLSQLLAHAVFDGIRACADVVVNFHTMNPYFESEPYAVYKVAGEGAPSEADILAAIACFTPSVACRMSVSSAVELPGNNAGALDYQCLKIGKLAFMIELGRGSSQSPAHVAAGVSGLNALAAHMGMTASAAPLAPALRRVTQRTHVFNRHGGFFRQCAPAGAVLTAGQDLGVVQDLSGQVIERIRFAQDVLVIGVRNDPVVHTGDRVGFVALDWDDYRA